MSFVKKIFRRRKTPKSAENSSSSERDLKGLDLSESSYEHLLSPKDQTSLESSLTDNASMKVLGASGSQENLSCDVAEKDSLAMCSLTNKTLNAAMKKLRKKELRLKKRQRDIICMQNEIRELKRLMHVADIHCAALEEEQNHKRAEMTALCSDVTCDVEDEIKKRESVCYKKYKNIKSKDDARQVLSMIKSRQRALRTLHVLAYKKFITYSNQLNISNQKTNTSTKTKDRKNLEELLRSLKERVESSERNRGVSEGSSGEQSVENRLESLQNAQNTLELVIQGRNTNSPPVSHTFNNPVFRATPLRESQI